MQRPIFIFLVLALTGTAFAQPKIGNKPTKPVIHSPQTAQTGASKAAPKPTPNTVKGQGQMAGLNGQFGTVYSLKNGFNVSIVSARYTVNSVPVPSQIYPNAGEKLLLIAFSLKNASPNDNWFNSLGWFTAVDQNGQIYQMGDSDVLLKSQGIKSNPILRPGQGIGQAGTTDPLEAVLEVPNAARIVKIMLNRERLNSKDETIRYYIAGASKAEAGAEGDPKNIVAALPDEVRDTADMSGAVALAEGKGTIGKAFNTRFLDVTVNSIAFAPAETKVDGKVPEEGKRFVVASLTVSAPADANGPKMIGSYDWPSGGNDSAIARLSDADGEKYTPLAVSKAKRDEPLGNVEELKNGESFSYRVFWAVPKDAALKKLVLGATNGRQWAFDVSALK